MIEHFCISTGRRGLERRRLNQTPAETTNGSRGGNGIIDSAKRHVADVHFPLVAATSVAAASATSAYSRESGRRGLRDALRNARTVAGFTQQEVATAMDWSLSKIIRIENGRVGVSKNDLRALLDHYQITDAAAVRELDQLAKASRGHPWWAQYSEYLMSKKFEKFIDLEGDADELQMFSPTMVPGLMQTRGYARAVLEGMVPPPTHDELEARVEVRVRRQEQVLERPDPPQLRAILDEAVLHRMMAKPADSREQLEHLVELAERPKVSIEILPFSAGIYELTGPFYVLLFGDDHDQDVAYVEGTKLEDLVYDRERVAGYRRSFEVMQRKAMSRDESIEYIAELAARHV